MNNIHFSSNSNEWTTPQDYFNVLNKEFNFTLDPCCTKKSSKCDKFYTLKDDGLSKDWSNEIVFMNPPYGREIKHWIKKAYEESLKGAIVVCLVPARTDTTYWHEYCMKGKVRFIKGRLKFSGKGSAPFPSALVVFS
jgi:phage N-6-adenine-methyltransferase|tara:strand:+ start:24 stop:434 length:411 start_codon:yes stop_codon:yes gene_type:complete